MMMMMTRRLSSLSVVFSSSRSCGHHRRVVAWSTRGLAGHSKWSNIRHKKGKNDSARGDLFTKLSRLIEAASRMAGGDRQQEWLASAISRARDADMPKVKIDAAVVRGSQPRAPNDPDLDRMTFEATGAGGVGLVIETLTDNRNRTTQDMKSILKKHGGQIGAEGSITWNWQRQGHITVDIQDKDEDTLLAAALDGGADDMERSTEDDDATNIFSVYTEPQSLTSARTAIADAGFTVKAASIIWRPSQPRPLSDDDDIAASFAACLDALDENPDVTEVFHDATTTASAEDR